MPESKQKIELPKASKGKGPSIRFLDPVEELVKRYDRQTYLIIAIFAVAMITMILMVSTIIIDSFHFNAATYREYSQKTDSYNQLLEANKTNQNLIIENNKQMIEILKDLQDR